MVTHQVPVPLGPEEIVFKGKLIEIVQQKMKAGDKEFTIERARRAPGTRLIITSPEKKLLLTQEYRMELQTWDTRLPGGKVLDSLQEYEAFLKSGNDILNRAIQAAKKEAQEEVGLAVEDIAYFATSSCGATITWDLYYFVVTKYTALSQGQQLEVGEHIRLIWVTLAEAKQMCLKGTIQEDRSAAILLRYITSLE